MEGQTSKVRGVVMNPVDHPNGGGEAKSKGGGGRQMLMSPWSQLAKGFPTQKIKGEQQPYPRPTQWTQNEETLNHGKELRSCLTQLKGFFVDPHLMTKVEKPRTLRPQTNSNLVSPIDDHPRIRGIEFQCPQREDFRAGLRNGKYGRPQAWRIFAIADVQSPRRQLRIHSEILTNGSTRFN